MARSKNISILSTFIMASVTAFFAVFSSAAYAANSQIGFSGVVTKPSQNDAVRDHPVELVSFGNQVMLPLSGLASRPGEVRVFNQQGQRVQTGAMTYMPVNGKRYPSQLVDLVGGGQQVFVVCKGSLSNCVRYRVTRH